MTKKRVMGSWPYEERSTRNCIHCKTTLFKGEARAYCSKGKHLAVKGKRGDRRYSMSLRGVLKLPRWASPACENCMLFEHDEAR